MVDYYEDPKYMFTASMLLLAISGLGIILIDNMRKSNTMNQRILLNYQLWKFQPKYSHQAHLYNYFLNSIKLVLASLMISALTNTFLIKFHPPKVAMLYSSILFGLLFVVLMTYLVYLLVTLAPPDETSESKATDKTNDQLPAKDNINTLNLSKTDSRIPITIITGFLGSGKTTLVKDILKKANGLKVLIIENEVGNEGIDHELLLKHTTKENIILMNNGCICCKVRGDLLTTFHKMFENEAFSLLDWIIIETTGLADPAPLIQTFYMDSQCLKKLRLDGIITLVDSYHFPTQSKNPMLLHQNKVNEVLQQISFANVILLNKVDLIQNSENLQQIIQQIQEINSFATIQQTKYSQIEDLSSILNIHAFDMNKISSLLSTSTTTTSSKSSFLSMDANGKLLKSTPSTISPEFTSPFITFTLNSSELIDLDLFNRWITTLLNASGENLYRVKGILSVADYQEHFIFHCIHMIFEGEKTANISDIPANQSKIVFIGINLDKESIEKGFRSTIRIKA